MSVPPKVCYATEQEYRTHFEQVYCQGPLVTFDGIPVRFRKSDFDHCMFESSQRNRVKDTFSRERAERMDWIKAALIDASADLRQGWDNKKRRVDPNRRVAIAHEDFTVIIQVRKRKTGDYAADFVTAYVASDSISKIRNKPGWAKK